MPRKLTGGAVVKAWRSNNTLRKRKAKQRTSFARLSLTPKHGRFLEKESPNPKKYPMLESGEANVGESIETF